MRRLAAGRRQRAASRLSGKHLGEDFAVKGSWAGQQRLHLASSLVPQEQLAAAQALVCSLQHPDPALLSRVQLHLHMACRP